MRGLLVSLIFLVCLPGCVVIKVGAKNPIPEMTTIAVAPFFNLTQEPNSVVDGRRFALAYFAELQKTPGFQVIPVGIVEAAILKHRINVHNPREALRLCEILEADAIVIGGVTDYSPFYPPRIGMQVDWYSPKEWPMPELNAESAGNEGLHQKIRARCRWPSSCPPEVVTKPETVRGQSVDTGYTPSLSNSTIQQVQQSQPPAAKRPPEPFGPDTPYNRRPLSPDEELQRYGRKRQADAAAPEQETVPQRVPGGQTPLAEEAGKLPPPSGFSPPVLGLPPADSTSGPPLPPPLNEGAPSGSAGNFDPTQPLMSYTRMFDGADTDVVNRLRDYLELRGDRRSGGWEAYLHRSEDFIRFTCHLMIVEMLSVHGGAVKSQMVVKWRKYR